MLKRLKEIMKTDTIERKKFSRVVALLTRDETDFIDKIAKDALYSTGHKLTRTEIIRAMVDVLVDKEISGEGVNSRSELERRLSHLMSRTIKDTAETLTNRKGNLQ